MGISQSLKGRILKGGLSLTLRQLLITGLSLVNVLVVARILGPESYGVVAIALGMFYFLVWTSKVGLNVYLVRQPDLPKTGVAHVLTFYNSAGLAVCLILAGVAPVFGWWTGESEITDIMRVLMLAVWLDMVASVSMSMLERELRFAEVGLVDALSQLINYAVAVALVLTGSGYWGPIIGTVLGFFVKACLAYRYHPVPWGWHWNWQFLKPALSYGFTYVSSDWILSTKNLIVPVLVSRLVGVSAAGIISIAIRLSQQLAILRLVIRQMSVSIMAKLIDAPEQVRNTVSQGMTYQALLIGPCCAVFSCLAVWVIPLVFGEEWLASVQIFPFVATGILVSSVFDLHSSTLYAIGHNRQVAKLNLCYVGLLWLVAAIALQTLGLWGYGIAEIAALPSFFVIHRSLSKTFGSPDYSNALWIVIATIIPLYGSIFLPPIPALGLLLASYGVLILLNAKIRVLPAQLLTTVRSR